MQPVKKTVARIGIKITPKTTLSFERCYFFVFISIILTTSDSNATNKDAKEHTNVKASQTDKIQPPLDRF